MNVSYSRLFWLNSWATILSYSLGLFSHLKKQAKAHYFLMKTYRNQQDSATSSILQVFALGIELKSLSSLFLDLVPSYIFLAV